MGKTYGFIGVLVVRFGTKVINYILQKADKFKNRIMNRYEYKTLDLRSSNESVKHLNELGEEGWELVSVVNLEGHIPWGKIRYVFKKVAGVW